MAEALDEAQLLERFLVTRDPALRESLILRYVPLVHYVLGRLGIGPDTSSEYEDLVSQGLLGLVDAVDRYDPAHGTRFSTYAAWRIRGSVLDHLRSMDWLSRGARRRVREAQEAIQRLWAATGQAPDRQALARELGLSEEEVEAVLLDASRQVLSLDASLAGPDEPVSLYETLEDASQTDPQERAEEADLQARLVEALQRLPEREQVVLSLYYYEGLTMREIGEVLSVSESRVCQIHAQAILNLQALLGAPEQATGEVSDRPVAGQAARLGREGVLA